MSPDAHDETIAIQTKDLAKRFGEKVAVDGINLTIKKGEMYGFLGPNGAGKSTTIKMLVTLMNPSGGDGWVLGHSISHDPIGIRLKIGVTLQEASLDEQQTGRELLKLQGRIYGLSKSQIDERVQELMTLVDIGTAIDKRISTYSGGMKRRLDLAAALVHNPEVLFLDEPTTGLDPVSRTRMWDEVRRLNKELGMTIFLTTQYLEEADQLADRVGIINNGKIVAEGTPAELKRKLGVDVIILQTKTDPQPHVALLKSIPGVDRVDVHNNEVTIATPDGSKAIGPIAAALHEAGVELEHLTLRTPSLDDVFLDATGNRLQTNETTA